MRKYAFLTGLIFPCLLWSQDISRKDILIVELSAKDAGIAPKSEESYQKNSNERQIVRKEIAEFIKESTAVAKFVIIDCYFPDLLDPIIDNQLKENLKSAKNVAIGGGSYPDREYSHKFFAESVPEVGHLIFQYAEKDKYGFFPEICADWPKFWEPIETCPKKRRERYIATIAVEQYLGIKLEVPPSIRPLAEHRLFKKFPRISYSEFKKKKQLAADKLVIFLPRILPSMYVHTTIDKRQVTDAEIIGTAIVDIFQLLPRK